mmetsp:Transcript_12177/g.14516  ORF Transcript_12177/g.14516 Transcript_12177/m.14516 type:complete len:240 (-) Transcript_12177:1086-1805(-)|eukprot:CAMPEP_0197853966 /NCGR_PEP_ID=MMETSP1438-20131217/23795_1 /TAXON_ID=1461541 /ORGANISM="Pterosperma sp., Strain CCMP1384" /LENGTH=239 /DNA_ID=CAMNT_0043468559 /DNA_START=187 /DNA_END=906 /DNA_ORIENTATION=-
MTHAIVVAGLNGTSLVTAQRCSRLRGCRSVRDLPRYQFGVLESIHRNQVVFTSSIQGRTIKRRKAVPSLSSRAQRLRVESKKYVEVEVLDDDDDDGPSFERSRGSGSSGEANQAREARDDAGNDFDDNMQGMAEDIFEEAQTNAALKLAFCICVDLLGNSSYLLPGLGEGTDIVWAPLQALILSRLFKSALVSSFGFIEEAFPGLDIVPTATIAWCIENLPAFEPIRGLFFTKEDEQTK